MAAQRVRIIGSFLSPYVRKVLVALQVKGIAYEIDPIVPFFGNEEFSRLSPLRRIPVLIDDAVTLCDSTVICEYLEELHPTPALLPIGPVDRARARWLEEYADTRLGDVFVWRLYYQLIVRRFVWGEEPDMALVAKARDDEIPTVLDYLEAQLPAEGLLFGSLTTADISIASFFRNAEYAGYRIDNGRWPKTAGFVARVLALPVFEALKRYEDATVGAPAGERRARLMQIGAPLAATTLMMRTPRRGVVPL
jgi:glutathione S-transferase